MIQELKIGSGIAGRILLLEFISMSILFGIVAFFAKYKIDSVLITGLISYSAFLFSSYLVNCVRHAFDWPYVCFVFSLIINIVFTIYDPLTPLIFQGEKVWIYFVIATVITSATKFDPLLPYRDPKFL